jgi:hypothetical protein
MDDFLTGPKDFDLYFTSTDPKVYGNVDGSYIFILKKPLEFANEWEIGVKQIIIKSPFDSSMYNVAYSSPDKPDERPLSKTFDLKSLGLPESGKDLINKINANIPPDLKQGLSFSVDDKNFVVMNIKNTQLKFENSYLSEVLGLKADSVYPKDYPTKTSQIKARQKIRLLHPIFFLKTDILAPGGETLTVNVFPDSNKYENYKYENVSYQRILRSYVSSINISFEDIYGNIFKFNSPIVIKFHLRRSLII